jgi:hypothetical protein
VATVVTVAAAEQCERVEGLQACSTVVAAALLVAGTGRTPLDLLIERFATAALQHTSVQAMECPTLH